MADKNATLALDLDLFDNTKNAYVPVEKKKKQAPAPKLLKPKLKTKAQIEAETKQSRLMAVKVVMITMVAMVILGSLIYSRVILTNLKSDLATENAALVTSQSENVRLQMKFNSMMSMDKVEEYAQTKLGMVKKESCQVNYFDLSKSDGAALTKSGKVN